MGCKGLETKINPQYRSRMSRVVYRMVARFTENLRDLQLVRAREFKYNAQYWPMVAATMAGGCFWRCEASREPSTGETSGRQASGTPGQWRRCGQAAQGTSSAAIHGEEEQWRRQQPRPEPPGRRTRATVRGGGASSNVSQGEALVSTQTPGSLSRPPCSRRRKAKTRWRRRRRQLSMAKELTTRGRKQKSKANKNGRQKSKWRPAKQEGRNRTLMGF